MVLKYRLPRPKGHVHGHEAPLADAARALALVRANAEPWGVDPVRVGMMGFSAGGHLAASASVQLKEGGPDFTALTCPVVSFLPGIGHDGSRNNLMGPRHGPQSESTPAEPQSQLRSLVPGTGPQHPYRGSVLL